MFRILALLLLPVICLAQVNSNGEKPTGELLSNEISPNEMKRNASFNLDEIKVRWKKAALENCTGVPCVVTPPAPSFTCGTSTVTDVDGNVYETVSIVGTGVTQCWTKTNLKVSRYNNSSPIDLDATETSPGDGTSLTWQNLLAGAYSIYDNESSTGTNATNYGFLYNWYAVTDSRKLCPAGWHVPTDAEWTIMIQTLDPNQVVKSGNDVSTFIGAQSSTAGTVMKSAATNLSNYSGLDWNPNTIMSSPGTNTSGFSALPGGSRNSDGSFNDKSDLAFFWSTTEYDPSNAWYRNLSYFDGDVDRGSDNKAFGASVRCLRD
jgi:uncharacterized protein (TIGR02145 family)